MPYSRSSATIFDLVFFLVSTMCEKVEQKPLYHNERSSSPSDHQISTAKIQFSTRGMNNSRVL